MLNAVPEWDVQLLKLQAFPKQCYEHSAGYAGKARGARMAR